MAQAVVGGFLCKALVNIESWWELCAISDVTMVKMSQSKDWGLIDESILLDFLGWNIISEFMPSPELKVLTGYAEW